MLGIDQEAHRISLGLKQIETNPWTSWPRSTRWARRSRARSATSPTSARSSRSRRASTASSTSPTSSWTKRVKHPSEVLKKGDTVEAVVLNIDAENQRLSLGLKQLATDMWDEFFSHHKVNDIVQGKVVRVTNFGAFVELHEGIEGLVHVSELDEKRIEKPEEAVKVGDVYAMKIIKINEGEKKIGLSIKAVKQDEYQQDLESYRESATRGQTSTATALGDAFRAAQAARDREEGVRQRRQLGPRDGRSSSRRAESQMDSDPNLNVIARPSEIHRMTKAELVDTVSRVSDLTRKHSEVIVEAVFSSIIEALQRGDKIELRGFGSFRIRKRDSRTGRNPKTGAGVVVPAKRVPHFKPGKELRELINRSS